MVGDCCDKKVNIFSSRAHVYGDLTYNEVMGMGDF